VNTFSFPENLWRVEETGQGLLLTLIRRFMGKETVLKKIAVADAAALPQTIGKSSNRTFLNLRREQGIVRHLQLPVDVQQDLKSALTLQIEAISAWPEQDVYWDYIVSKAAERKRDSTQHREKETPRLLQITVVIIPKTVLESWLQTFEAARIPLAGASLAGFDVNVLPASLRRGSARVQVVASYVLAACLLLVGLAFLLRAPYQQRVYASQIQQEITRLEPEVKRLVKEEAALGVLTKRYEALLAQVQKRDSNLVALNTLASVLPPDTFLLNYRYQTDTVTVSGVSASALTVQSALEKSPVFKNVQFSAPINRDPSGKDRFSLTMSIEAGQ
jgi:Tfp pilus assembly protein PilN